MQKILIEVVLPKNRRYLGSLRLIQNRRELSRYKVLGRGARKEKGNTVFLENGNTPTGTYKGTLKFRTNDFERFGKNGAVELFPKSGDARIAQDIFGRENLQIHGGRSKWGPLIKRNTFGCLRMKDNDVKDMVDKILKARYSEGMCHEKVEIEVTVSETW